LKDSGVCLGFGQTGGQHVYIYGVGNSISHSGKRHAEELKGENRNRKNVPTGSRIQSAERGEGKNRRVTPEREKGGRARRRWLLFCPEQKGVRRFPETAERGKGLIEHSRNEAKQPLGTKSGLVKSRAAHPRRSPNEKKI